MTKIIIIGGGPAGIVTLKTLLESSTSAHPLEPILFEAAPKLGGTFSHRSYQNAELVSSRQLTAFSDFRIPANKNNVAQGGFGDHMSLGEYVEYLENYVDHFDLDGQKVDGGAAWDGQQGRIRLGIRVVRVERVKDDNAGGKAGQHVVSFVKVREGERGFGLERSDSGVGLDELGEEIQTLTCDAIAICTGLHVLPAIPKIPGIEAISERIHSSRYKGRSQLVGKKVLILGAGETAMDIGYESIKAGAKEVTMCHRGGFLSFPKVLNDFRVFGVTFDGQLPIDGLITNSYVSVYRPLPERIRPPLGQSHSAPVASVRLRDQEGPMVPHGTGCNQWVGELPKERLGRAYVFLNKSSKAMPYINRPYQPRFRLMSYIARYIDPKEDAESDKTIDLAPWPERVDETGRVHFDSSRDPYAESRRMKSGKHEVRPDLVVYATGYKQEWSWLEDGKYPKGPEQVDVRDVTSSNDTSVAFIGFVRPGVGAIPPIAEMQAYLWTSLLLKKCPIPTGPPHYRLLASDRARIQYGVDHSTYMSTLAKDIGASPDLWELLRTHGLHVTVCYCFCASFVVCYRLLGPYRSPSAPKTMKTEIWDTVLRRGVMGNLMMGLIPMAFYGVVNITAYIVEQIWLASVKPVVRAVRPEWVEGGEFDPRAKKVELETKKM